MVEVLKKSIFATIGIAMMTREKTEELGKKIVAEARLSETEGRQFVEELLQRGDESRNALEEKVANQVDKAIKKLHLVSRKEFDALERRVSLVEQSATDTTL